MNVCAPWQGGRLMRRTDGETKGVVMVLPSRERRRGVQPLFGSRLASEGCLRVWDEVLGRSVACVGSMDGWVDM